MKKQKNTRTVIIFLIFLAILFGLLSFAVAKELSTTKVRSTQATSYRTYTSITGSGLTVTYPSSWSIFPAEEVKKSQAGGTFAATLLISQKSTPKDGHPEVPTDHVCVSLTEMAGPWPYRFMPPSDITTRSDFSLGSTTVSLAEPTSPVRVISMRSSSISLPRGHTARHTFPSKMATTCSQLLKKAATQLSTSRIAIFLWTPNKLVRYSSP